MAADRIARFVRVCQRNQWPDLEAAWSKLSAGVFTEKQIETPEIDTELERRIVQMVETSFTKLADTERRAKSLIGL
jgi:hypothetical protein